MKCVVPIVTDAMQSDGSADFVSTDLTAFSIPAVTSGVVGVLWWARTPREGSSCCFDGSMATASVLVPAPVSILV